MSPLLMAMFFWTFMLALCASRESRFRSCRAAHVGSGTHTGEGCVVGAGGVAVTGAAAVGDGARALCPGTTVWALAAAVFGAGSAVVVIAVGCGVDGDVGADEAVTVVTGIGVVGRVLTTAGAAFLVATWLPAHPAPPASTAIPTAPTIMSFLLIGWLASASPLSCTALSKRSVT